MPVVGCGPLREHAWASRSGLEVGEQRRSLLWRRPLAFNDLAHTLFDGTRDCFAEAGDWFLLVVIKRGVLLNVRGTLIVHAVVDRAVVCDHGGILVNKWRAVLEEDEVFVIVHWLGGFIAIHEAAVVEVICVYSGVLNLEIMVAGIFQGRSRFAFRTLTVRVILVRRDILSSSPGGLVLRSHGG